MRKRMTASLLILLMMGGTLSACSGVKEEEAGTADGGGATVKLRIMWWGSQARHDATLKALDAYASANPGVAFEPEYQSFDGYQDKLSTMSAGKNTPDLFQMDAAWFNDWASSGRLEDLSSIPAADIDTSLLETGTYEGKLYAMPLGNNAWGMIYNKTMMDSLGVAPPTTWDEFFQLARDIKPKLAKDQYLSKDLTADGAMYMSYQLSMGKGYSLSKDGKFHYDEATWKDWMNKWAVLRQDKLAAPPDVTVSDKGQDAQMDLLVQKKILLKGAHAAEFGGFDALMPGDLALTALPRGAQASGWLKASMYWSVSPNSKHKEEAKKFIDWFVNSEEAAAILGTSRGIPVSRTVVEAIQQNFTAVDKNALGLIETVSKDGSAFDPGPGNKGGWANFTKEYDNIVQSILFGKIGIDEGWEQVVGLSRNLG
ncbi:ABC transporter substrate-binding protein [Paenibacillus sp. B01]|uniref:ABC transporter substrate-binding protein n=1 Tax=Paenibacillus sp. B01 TaxID=2660554 RepID=UPI001E5D41B6|nr:extracellular solute-binding protein [Paenibacillus sp. B01]